MDQLIRDFYPLLSGFLQLLTFFWFFHNFPRKTGPIKAIPVILRTLLIAEVMQLCYGISNGIITVLAPLLYPHNPALFSFVFMIAGDLLALGLTCLCCWLLLQSLPSRECTRDTWIILAPLLMIFWANGYISHTFYGDTVTIAPSSPYFFSDYVPVLGFQVLGVISIFSVIYIQQRLSAVKQQIHFQQKYVEKAQAHYDRTRSFRHDIKNHLFVVTGLLRRGLFEKARAYLNDLDSAADTLSFPIQTNHPVLDILLENKSVLADSKGIHITSTLRIPVPCSVSDIDFCTILSNTLDNAIQACERLDAKEKKFIRLSSRSQGDFLLLEIENSFGGSQRFTLGTGLSNVRQTVKKYGGTVDAQIQGKVFLLRVLLVISQQPENTSQQTHCAPPGSL